MLEFLGFMAFMAFAVFVRIAIHIFIKEACEPVEEE
jgi:hypothetical protein